MVLGSRASRHWSRSARRPAATPGVIVASPSTWEVDMTDADVSARFEEIVQRISELPQEGPVTPSNELKLQMYGLYRQARDGDVSGKRPGMFDMVGRFKHDAWAANRGMSRDEAMRRYIETAEAFARDIGETI
jgi:diazepam-binding inhibitor (GABA receptor modulator, acyl-CoA-binding protein)